MTEPQGPVTQRVKTGPIEWVCPKCGAVFYTDHLVDDKPYLAAHGGAAAHYCPKRQYRLTWAKRPHFG